MALPAAVPSPILNITRTLMYTNGDVFGGAGNDTLAIVHGRGLVDGGAGNDVMSLTYADGRMSGGAGNDVMRVLFGRAALDGGSGNDTMSIRHGEGVLTGGAGNDALTFDYSRGQLLGGDGNDWLVARNSDGVLDGGTGVDTLTMIDSSGVMKGGAGADLLVLGTGMQGVTFDSAAEGGDRVLNFDLDFDWIQLSGKAFGGMAAGKMTAEHFSTNTAHGTAAQVIFNTTSGKLYWDADGTGSGAAVLLAEFRGLTHLTADTFLIT